MPPLETQREDLTGGNPITGEGNGQGARFIGFEDSVSVLEWSLMARAAATASRIVTAISFPLSVGPRFLINADR
jgi:hypothetical protein